MGGSLDTKIKLFPNPTDSILNFQTTENLANANVEIYDVLGRLMHKEPLTTNRIANVNYLKSGSYVLRLTRSNEVLCVKTFVKK